MSSTVTIIEPPFGLEYTLTCRSKEGEEALRQVQVTIVAGGALVCNRSLMGFTTIGDGDRLSAIRSWIASTVLCRVQGNNKVTGVVVTATSA